MQSFFRTTNNGFTAVVSEEVHKEIQRWIDSPYNRNLPYPGPIFVFTKETNGMPWLTGDYGMMDYLLSPHLVVESESISVPFSNRFELFGDGTKDDARKALEKWMPTNQQFIDTFGLSIKRTYPRVEKDS